jgi:hypothetical protein
MNRIAILALCFLVAAGPASAAALTGIGVAAAVRGMIRAQAPGQTVGREVSSGKPVFLNDHVTTGAGARMQILLLDQTTFTIGPNSDMVLDEFVYDPATGAGKVTAQITKGVFRFVTGKVAQRNPADMKVRLPVGTIGIRGTIVEGSVDGRNADIMLAGPGPDNNANERPGGITVTNAGGSTDIDASGFGTSIVNGGAPSVGYRFSPAQVGALQVGLNAGGTGGPDGASNGGGQNHASAGETSGQDTASGGVNFRTSAGDLVAQSGDTSNFAAQQTGPQSGSANGPSTWDQILAIPSGTGEYHFDGSYTGCTSCSSSPSTANGTFSSIIPVDFGSGQLGGNINGRQGSISLSGDVTDSVNINAVDYRSFAGALPAGTRAALTFTAANVPLTNSSGNFANTVFQFNNASGVAGGGATLTLVYKNTSTDASLAGTTTATKVAIPPL